MPSFKQLFEAVLDLVSAAVMCLQAAPKSCGHVRGKRVVSRGEAVARIRAAADARDESKADIVLVARTDARQAESLEVSWLKGYRPPEN